MKCACSDATSLKIKIKNNLSPSLEVTSRGEDGEFGRNSGRAVTEKFHFQFTVTSLAISTSLTLLTGRDRTSMREIMERN